MGKKLPHPTILAALAGVYFLLDFIFYFIEPGGVTLLLLYINMLAFIGYLVLQCVFLYRLWELVQTSDFLIEKPTPAEAIGFWFIPFYGLFWTFILWKNLATHLNHLTGRKVVPELLVTIGCGLFIPGSFGVVLKGLYFYLWGLLFYPLLLLVGNKTVSILLIIIGEELFVPGTSGVVLKGLYLWGPFLYLYPLFLGALVIFLITDYQFYKSVRILAARAELSK